MHLISNVNLLDRNDRWIWCLDREKGFLVKSVYYFLNKALLPQYEITPLEIFTFKNLWKSSVPSKVSWSGQLLLDKIPTRQNLYYRGVSWNTYVMCAMCGGEAEMSMHLFFHCHYAAAIWYVVARWLGVIMVLPSNMLMLMV
ncbi:hypothetical protein TSUD_101400 [Trifolium subterraneum]|uniref:Reverse transcriptase zinc-binding domain-containing protein n=1 Tax=Trifolium subterraneum TaxID=3900 RepID=A0A2Z6NM32_TRISU|nr:hypothetical protein TSUD_101400 [Trifolium subterraneum]